MLELLAASPLSVPISLHLDWKCACCGQVDVTLAAGFREHAQAGAAPAAAIAASLQASLEQVCLPAGRPACLPGVQLHRNVLLPLHMAHTVSRLSCQAASFLHRPTWCWTACGTSWRRGSARCWRWRRSRAPLQLSVARQLRSRRLTPPSSWRHCCVTAGGRGSPRAAPSLLGVRGMCLAQHATNTD